MQEGNVNTNISNLICEIFDPTAKNEECNLMLKKKKKKKDESKSVHGWSAI